jgi:hypothetical protein
MALLRYNDSTLMQTVFSTELNAIANNTRVLSDPLDNTFDLDVYADFELLVKYNVVPPVGAKIAEIFIIPTVDGSNYAEGSVSVQPQKYLIIGAYESVNPSISNFERLMLTNIVIPPRSFKILLRNTSGVDYAATGNTLKMKKFKLESI